MKKVLIFFGTEEYSECKKRLYGSANKYFDEIVAYGKNDIDADFYNSNLRIFENVRGWGYWLWKPYFILKTLLALNDDDLCFYVDSTAVFVTSPEILFEFCSKSDGIVLFENAHFKNYVWTKADCFNMMGMNSENYVYGRQVDAAFQLYKKNRKSISFVQQMLFYATNYNIISDAPNETGDNHPGFKDHRHDQSILSLLAIKFNIGLVKSPRRSHSEFERILELRRDPTI